MSPRIMHIDTNTGATLSATPSPDLCSDGVVFEPTIEGELQRLRQDFDKYRADEATNHAADEERHRQERKFDRMFSILTGALAGAIGSTVANIIAIYWPSILAFFEH